MKTQARRALRLTCILVAALAPAAAAAQNVPTAAEVLARVRGAVGYGRLHGHSNGVAVEGTARYRGLDTKFSLLFTPDGRFRTEVAGPLGGVTGFDGAAGWEVDSTGMPRVLEFQDLELAQLDAWVYSSRWMAEDSPFAISLDASKTDDKQVALKLNLKQGVLEATIFVDRATWLPKTVRRRGSGGEEVMELGDYRDVMGFRFPHRFTRSVGGVTNAYEVRTVAAAPAGSLARFERVTTRPNDARWDNAVAPSVEVRRARSGHMLVRPLVNGKEIGWFILDSGASAMVIDPKAADRLGLPALGEVIAVGAAGTVKARFRQGETFQLGPLTVNGTRYMEFDLEFLSRAFGVPVGGICGRDFFARAVVEIDITDESVAVHDPARYKLEGAGWQELYFSGRIPAVRARFEGGREGLFRLDTGSGWTVSFHAPAVESLKLLAGRETRETHSGGVGGSAASRAGRLTWFELGGRRFEGVEVEFTGVREGAFSDVYTMGNIGAGLLREFRVIFDYGNKRAAFAPLKATKPEGAPAPRVGAGRTAG
jgi:hypothetical protein